MKFFAVFAAILAIAVARPGPSAWTLQELSDTLQNPNVNPAVVPLLEDALNALMEALFNGHMMEFIHVPLAADIPVILNPVVPEPVIPPVSPVETPAVQATSPLVQIIVNVKGQQQVADVPVPVEVGGSPVDVVEKPVQVVEKPEVAPEPVIVEEIAQAPINPIDIIAVNPIDSWGPAGFNPVVGSEDVGPM